MKIAREFKYYQATQELAAYSTNQSHTLVGWGHTATWLAPKAIRFEVFYQRDRHQCRKITMSMQIIPYLHGSIHR